MDMEHVLALMDNLAFETYNYIRHDISMLKGVSGRMDKSDADICKAIEDDIRYVLHDIVGHWWDSAPPIKLKEVLGDFYLRDDYFNGNRWFWDWEWNELTDSDKAEIVDVLINMGK